MDTDKGVVIQAEGKGGKVWGEMGKVGKSGDNYNSVNNKK